MRKILDHTSILKFLGEKFDAGRYSNLVDNRAVESASEALDDQLLANGSRTPPPVMS